MSQLWLVKSVKLLSGHLTEYVKPQLTDWWDVLMMMMLVLVD